MSAPTVAMMSSPFLGAGPWRGLADAAARRGRRAEVVTLPTPPVDAAAALAGYAARLPGGDTVLLAHSNAGLYVPRLVTEHPGVRAVVFLDAVLPPDGEPEAGVAPPALIEHLASRVGVDGLLPRWTDWWEDAQVDELLPTPGARGAVTADQPRVPLSYLHDAVAVPDGWQRVPACYIAFGDTYEPELADAAARGWPTVRIAGAGHLHMVVDPEAVMSHLEDFLRSSG